MWSLWPGSGCHIISSCWSNEAEIIQWRQLSHIVAVKPSDGHDPYCRPLQLIVKCTNKCVRRLRLRLIFLTLWQWSTSKTCSTDRVINTELWLYWLYGGCLFWRLFFLMSELESDKGLYLVWLPGSSFALSLFQQIRGASQQGCLCSTKSGICLSFTASVCPCGFSDVFLNNFRLVHSVSLFFCLHSFSYDYQMYKWQAEAFQSFKFNIHYIWRQKRHKFVVL